MAQVYPVRNFAREAQAGPRQDDNARVLDALRALPAGAAHILCQPRLRVQLELWQVRGDIDLIRAERRADGHLHLLIADCKSSAQSRVEYRLQVAFYHRMLSHLLQTAGIRDFTIQTAILFRGPAQPAAQDDPAAEEEAERSAQRRLAQQWLGAEDALLEIVADADTYLAAVGELVTDPDSVAERAAKQPFDKLHFTLSSKCDGCRFNAFCMQEARDKDDLSLIPYLNGREKKALLACGVTTATALAHLKTLEDTSARLLSAPDASAALHALAGAGIAAQVDELALRARRVKGLPTLPFIPGSGHCSLPYADKDINANQVCVYLTAQQDYLQGRVFLLGARIVAYAQGMPVRERDVVCATAQPPAAAQLETDLFAKWTAAVLGAVAELAETDAIGERCAPLHLIFWNAFEKRSLLEGLNRAFPCLGGAGAALYDLATQSAAFDTPMITHLDEEVRRHKNYAVLCPSLQNIATSLGFDWTEGTRDYRKLFRARLFDGGGREEATGAGYTRLARFNSQMPMDYAYAAWDDIPAPEAGAADAYREFRGVTPQILEGFQIKRLQAMQRIAAEFRGNDKTDKQPFRLPDLSAFSSRASSLAGALEEFVLIERHACLSDWKTTRHLTAAQRALRGETLLVSYQEEDQEEGVAAQCRDNEQRRQLKEQYLADLRAVRPDATARNFTASQKEASKWSQQGMRFRLRVEAADTATDLETLLGLCDFEEGDRFVLMPIVTVDERRPEQDRVPFQPTPKQMLYGTRVQLIAKKVRYSDKRIAAASVLVEEVGSMSSNDPPGFLFGAMPRPPQPGAQYTLDPDPNNISGLWNMKVIRGLQELETGGQRHDHALYGRLADPESAPGSAFRPDAALQGQRRFLDGLRELHARGALHDFEDSKEDYIGSHGADPVLLVQGPPGTGKSYSTAYAVFARLQGLLCAGQEGRVLLSCKTHKAIDVLIQEAAKVQRRLADWREKYPGIWEACFDARLLDIPIYRIAPAEPPGEGVRELVKDADRAKGTPANADTLLGHTTVIAGATPGAIYTLIKEKWDRKGLFGHHFCDLLVLDEASQMSLPEAMLAALPLKPGGQLVVVGDIRQMPPIVQHDWKSEARRTFAQFPTYESLFEALKILNPPFIGFAESFRIHAVVADYLREEIYRHDGIAYHSQVTKRLPALDYADAFVAAVLSPQHPLVVIVHDEQDSQNRNPFEEALIGPVLRALSAGDMHNLDARTGLGVVVPHRAQRIALRRAYPQLTYRDTLTDAALLEAVDTVERFQGGERDVILISATESDPEYLLANAEFLLDPRRLTVALSRAKKKLIVVASRSIFEYFSTEEELFLNSQLWKRLLRQACTVPLWDGLHDQR